MIGIPFLLKHGETKVFGCILEFLASRLVYELLVGHAPFWGSVEDLVQGRNSWCSPDPERDHWAYQLGHIDTL